MTPIEELKNYYQIDLLERTDAWYSYPTITPAHTFTSFIKWLPSTETLYNLSVRDDHSEKLVKALISQADEFFDQMNCNSPIIKTDDLAPSIYPFTSLVYINCNCHDLYRTLSPNIHAKTVVFFQFITVNFLEMKQQLRFVL